MTPAWSKNISSTWSLSHDWESLPLPSIPSLCNSPLPLSNRTRRSWLCQKTHLFLDVKCLPSHFPSATFFLTSTSPPSSHLQWTSFYRPSWGDLIPVYSSSRWAGLATRWACSHMSSPLCWEPGFMLYLSILCQNISYFYLSQFLCLTVT